MATGLDPKAVDLSHEYRVPVAYRPDRVLRRPREAVGDDDHTCPNCGGGVFVKHSGLGRPFFAHRHTEAICDPAESNHRGAMDYLRSVLELVVDGRLRLDLSIDCRRCRSSTVTACPSATRVVTQFTDAQRGLRYDLALLAGDVLVAAFEVHHRHRVHAAKAAAMTMPWFELRSDEICSDATQSALAEVATRGSASLVLRAERWSTLCACSDCVATEAREAAAREQERVDREAQRAALFERTSRELHSAFVGERVVFSATKAACGRCGRPRESRVSRGAAYHDAAPSFVDAHGQRWDVALLHRDRGLVLGVLVVDRMAFACEAKAEPSFAGGIRWITVPTDGIDLDRDGSTPRIRCSHDALDRAKLRCPVCDRRPSPRPRARLSVVPAHAPAAEAFDTSFNPSGWDEPAREVVPEYPLRDWRSVPSTPDVLAQVHALGSSIAGCQDRRQLAVLLREGAKMIDGECDRVPANRPKRAAARAELSRMVAQRASAPAFLRRHRDR